MDELLFETGLDPFFVIFGIFFVAALLFILFQVIKSIGQWHHNNQSPRETQKAVVVTKRSDTTHHMSTHDSMSSSSSSTTYYATFELENGERLEFTVKGKFYGQLVEGDNGYLTFQGTRFVAFERIPEKK